VHPIQLGSWKKQAVDGLVTVFTGARTKVDADSEALANALYQEIGQLKMELDWLKKNLDSSLKDRRCLVSVTDSQLSVAKQCELLGLARSSYYYQPVPESEDDLELMSLIDELYTEAPILGSRRMVAWLAEYYDVIVNRKRVQRLMRKMNLEVIYPKPRLTWRDVQHKVFPYLLRGIIVDHIDQVWSTDITYIRTRHGFLYLTAVIDWYSRYVLSWELSNTLEAGFCVSTLESALRRGTPEIFNTDQGSQYTSTDFVGVLEASNIRISMDGRGRALDNIFIERFWRTVKYEEVYIKDYATGSDAFDGLKTYFQWYNCKRLHQSLGYRTPESIYLAVGEPCLN
jgi:putative transposase